MMRNGIGRGLLSLGLDWNTEGGRATTDDKTTRCSANNIRKLWALIKIPWVK